MRKGLTWLIPLLLVGSGLLLLLWSQRPFPNPLPPFSTPTATSTPEPLLPTRTPTPVAETAVTEIETAVSPTNTPTPIPQAPTPPPQPSPFINPPLPERFGISGGVSSIIGAREAGLPVSIYLNWNLMVETPEAAQDLIFWQMVRLLEGEIRPSWEEIETAVRANPGSVWIVGNEPDVKWQDNTPPDQYTHLYHDVYAFIKEIDPTAQIAVAGVAQPTPLRLAYLDIVLETYESSYGEPMPVDIWTVHNFILREEFDSWGVEIPPGLGDELAIQFEVEDHDNLEIFRQHLHDFRDWMAANGYQERPLAVTEYGILMPVDFGYTPDVVAQFLLDTFPILMHEQSPNGYPADANRLVQWWFWYSVYDNPDYYPTGNLYDPETQQLTPIGRAFADYVNNIPSD
jgi:hypothetical protein